MALTPVQAAWKKSTKVYHILEIQNWESELSDGTFQRERGCISADRKRK